MPRRVKPLLLCLFCSYQWTGCTTSGLEPPGWTCPLSWTLSEGVCFKLFKGTKSFSSAAQQCGELPWEKATLAKITSAEQSEAAAALVRKSDLSFAWMGLRMTLQAATSYSQLEGCCRTSEGQTDATQGTFTFKQGVSLADCKNQCSTQSNCTAFEHLASSNTCEIHTATIASGADGTACQCFIKAVFTISGASGFTSWKQSDQSSATPLNGAFLPFGLVNGKPYYKNSAGASVMWGSEADKNWAVANLGTSGAPKWVAIANGHHRYYNEAATQTPPTHGWVVRQSAAAGNIFLSYQTTTTSTQACASSIDGGGWTLVRHTASSGNWGPWNDDLDGLVTHGSPGNSTSGHHWTIPWDSSTKSQYLFVLGDCSQWLIADKTQLDGTYANYERVILKSSLSSTSYTARWYNRATDSEDPWISLQDHSSCYDGCMLYGEDSSGGNLGTKNHHGGANVYVRQPTRRLQAPEYRRLLVECYTSDYRYTPVDMSGQGRTVTDNAAQCQERCASVFGCAHFSWWGNGGCHLQDSDASLAADKGVTAGPPTCHQARSYQLRWTDGSGLEFLASSYSPLHQGQECVMMNTSKDQEGAWSHTHCDMARPVLCSMPATATGVDAINMSNTTDSDATLTTTTEKSGSSSAGTSEGSDSVPTNPTTEDSDTKPDDPDVTSTTTEISTTPTAASSMNESDSPIAERLAARVEKEETNLRKQLLSSNKTQVTISTKVATISVQKLDISLVSDDSKSIPVAVENTTVEVLVPVSLLKSIGKPVVLQITAFREVPKAAQGDQEVRVKGMVSVNLFDLNGGRRKVNGLDDKIEIRLPINATEGATCAFWNETESNWSTEGLQQLSSSPGGQLVCSTSHLTLFGAIFRGFERAMACSQGHLFSEMGFRELLKGTWYKHTAVVIVWCLVGFILVMLLVACCLDIQRSEDGVWDDSVFIVLTVNDIELPSTPHSLAEFIEAEERCIGRCCLRIKSFMNDYIWPVVDPLVQEVIGNIGDFCSVMVDFMGAFRELLLEEEEQEDGAEEDEPPRRRCLCWGRPRCCCKLGLGWKTLLNGGLTKALLTVVKLQASTRLMMSVTDVQLLFDAAKNKTIENEAKNKNLSLSDNEAVTVKSKYSVDNSVDKPALDRQMSKREVILNRREERLRNTLPRVLSECRSCRSLPRTLWQIFVAKNLWLSVLHSSISQPAVLNVLLSASLWLGDMAIIALFFSTDPSSSVGKRGNRNSNCKHDGMFEEFGALLAVSIWSSLASIVPCWILGTLHRRSFVEFDSQDLDAYHRQIRIWRRRDRVLFVMSILYCATCLLFVMTFHAHVLEQDGIKWMYSVLFSVGSEFFIVPLVIALMLGLSAHTAARKNGILEQAVAKLGFDVLEDDQENAAGKMATNDNAQQEDTVNMIVENESVCLGLKKEAASIALELPGALPDSAEDTEALLEKTVDAGTLEMQEVHPASQQGSEREIVNGREEVTDGAGDAALSLQSAREAMAGEAPPHPESLPEKPVEAIEPEHMEQVHEALHESAAHPEMLLEKTVARMDADNDGSLDVEDVHKALQENLQWSNMTEEEKVTVRASFELIDTDGSGNIELNELKVALKAMGIDEEQAEMIFHETDLDTNGKINLKEFLALVT